MHRGVHGEKIVAAIGSDKMPTSDIPRLKEALNKYDEWIKKLSEVNGETLDEIISKMVSYLNEYKLYIDVNLIFDSEEDFLYRQKGQLKLDNTVIEEFIPILVKKCLLFKFGKCDIEVGS